MPPTIEDLKNAGLVMSTTSSFNAPIWPVQKIDFGEWLQIIIKSNQVVIPFAAAIPDVLSLLEQIDISPT